MAAITSFLLIVFLLIVTFHQTSAATDDSSTDTSTATDGDCTGRWIYIRNLPPRFNLHLLSNCSVYPLFDDFCAYLANHGLGHKTHNNSRSWYRTDSFLLELLFHRRILEYPCLTADPDHASAVFLPYYAAVDALRYWYGADVNSSAQHGLDLFDFVKSDSPHIWGKNMGHDHFLVMARPAWDFSQPPENDPPIWGTSFLELPQFYNVTALIVESRPYPWQEQAIPYPTSFHPPSLGFRDAWIRRVRRSRRTSLMLFAGGGGVGSTPNIRRSIRTECENANSNNSLIDGGTYSTICDLVDCSNGICEHDPIRYMRPMLQASFCLQPPGDTPTRRSTFDAITAGCIPVFFEELSAKSQYSWHLPEERFSDFSVSIPKEDVVYKGLKILDVLMGIESSQVRKMRDKVVELIPRVTYRRHGSSLGLRNVKDAFDIAMEGALQRIKSRVEGLSEQSSELL